MRVIGRKATAFDSPVIAKFVTFICNSEYVRVSFIARPVDYFDRLWKIKEQTQADSKRHMARTPGNTSLGSYLLFQTQRRVSFVVLGAAGGSETRDIQLEEYLKHVVGVCDNRDEVNLSYNKHFKNKRNDITLN